MPTKDSVYPDKLDPFIFSSSQQTGGGGSSRGQNADLTGTSNCFCTGTLGSSRALVRDRREEKHPAVVRTPS